MEKVKLSRRLAAIAALVPRGSVCIDVGTDHGYVPAWLIQNGVCPRALASDINAGPLDSARRTARAAGTAGKTEFLLCSGLDACPENGADAIVIAGMGGETIAAILEAAPWTRNGAKLILQPQSRPELLRRWLTENGYVITQELLVEDGRIYQLLTARGGASTAEYSQAEYHLGAFGQISASELFPRYLDAELCRAEKAISGLLSSRTPDMTRLEAQRELLAQYAEMKERLGK